MSLCCFINNPAEARIPIAFDIDRAYEICDSLPLDNIEGIWLYPSDHVSVLVLRKEPLSATLLMEYEIRVLESYDSNLMPGECIGNISSTSDAKKFSVELFTERKGVNLLKPKTCTAILSNDCDVLTLRHSSLKYRLRLNLNPSALLPNLWKSIIRIGTSSSGKDSETLPNGMIKTYPSYDGNGSLRRNPRYL
ncbi:MAG: hypothetical protein K2I16_09725 [Muribaculaceae bacterium]|nr:hypothetical protein [Muribaculaceae bacterium]MDE5713882.1 hypothetical protein [Muribaculaceae bacterium]